MTDPEQAAFDSDDLMLAMRVMLRARRDYQAAKDTLRELKQQTRRAESLVKEKQLRLVSAELRLGTLIEGATSDPPDRR